MMNRYATAGVALVLSAALHAFAAPDEEALGKSKGYPVCPSSKGSLSPEYCLVGVMSHYHEAYPARAVKKADAPRELKRGAEPKIDHSGSQGGGFKAVIDSSSKEGMQVMSGRSIVLTQY